MCVVGRVAAHQVVQVPAAHVPTGREDESFKTRTRSLPAHPRSGQKSLPITSTDNRNKKTFYSNFSRLLANSRGNIVNKLEHVLGEEAGPGESL